MSVDRMIIYNNLGDVDVKVWSGLMWLRIFTNCGAFVNMTMHILVL